MRGHIRRHAVAYLALAVAISGGTAYAATTLPANSVGTAQLRNDSVTRSKLAHNALPVRGLRGLRGAEGPQGPEGAEGLPGVQGPTGNTGPQGPQGPAGPATTKGDKGDTGRGGRPARLAPSARRAPRAGQVRRVRPGCRGHFDFTKVKYRTSVHDRAPADRRLDVWLRVRHRGLQRRREGHRRWVRRV